MENALIVLAVVWLVSAAAMTAIGYFRGRTADAATVGILFGPVALALALVMLSARRERTDEGGPQVLKITAADRRRAKAEAKKKNDDAVRRAA